MTPYNNVLNELQYYVLNEENIKKSLEMKIKYVVKDKKTETKNGANSHAKLNTDATQIFFPIEKDSLFWCFFILHFGEAKYETTCNKNEIISKQIKIDYIEKIRKEKQFLKNYKFDTMSNIENNLANEQILNVKSFLTLCAIENINVLFVNNKSYYELIMNDSNCLYIVYASNNKNHTNYNIRYGYELNNNDNANNTANNIKSKLYKLDNIDKPIKAISSYKVSDLIEICNKLSIEIKTESGKEKLKKDLYESIVQYF